MKLKSNVIRLDDKNIKKIQSITTTRKFPIESDLFYEGQTPCVAYLLLEGQINLLKGRSVRSRLDSGYLIGVPELMKHEPASLGAQICANTSVCFIDRSTIIEILENHHDEELAGLFQELVSA